MHRELHNFSINENQKERVDYFMDEKEINKRNRRRNSFSNDFTMNQYIYLVKAKSHKVFNYLTITPITKIIEVKSFSEMQDHLKHFDVNKGSPENRKNEEANEEKDRKH
jgi:hypothetical protein